MRRWTIFHARTRACILLALLGLSGATAAVAAPEDAAADLARAEELLAAGRLYPAEQAVRDALESEPDWARAHHLLGRILIRREKPVLAVAALERAAALEPTLSGLDRDLGLARFDADDFTGARDAFVRALERDSGDTLLRLRLGLCDIALGDSEQAAREFERAANDPAHRQIALYYLGVAREQAGRREEARDAFERAVALDPPTAIASRAWARVQVLEQTEDERPWHVALGAGLLYDSNVGRPEIDRASGDPDGAGQLEFGASGELPVRDWFEIAAGYDFYQTLYFDTQDFDLQSHGFRVAAQRRLGPADAALGYVYSLSTLDAKRFLDFHELRPSLGIAPAPWWYVSLGPAWRVKRFEQDPPRDAEQAALGLLSLFPLGDWKRHALVGLDFERENADSSAFDYRGLASQLAFHLPFAVGEREWTADLRYRFRWRDYTRAASAPDGRREDLIHSARVRLEIPIARYVAIRTEYEFEDATSDLRSADYTSHVVGVSVRFAM